MFIFDDNISSLINADKIYRIEPRYFKNAQDKNNTDYYAFGKDGESFGKINYCDTTLLSFQPCALNFEIVNVYFDEKTQETFTSLVPVIGWGETLGNSRVPVGLDLEPAQDISNGRWGLRVIGQEEIIVPYVCTHNNIARFQEDVKKEFIEKIK